MVRKKGIRFFLQKECEVILELSDKYSVLSLCNEMNINRSGFYKWIERRQHPSKRALDRNYACNLFEQYLNILLMVIVG